MALYLTTPVSSLPLEFIPLRTVDGKVVRMGDLATFDYKDVEPDSYFRVNGQSVVYLNVYINASADKLRASRLLRERMRDLASHLRKGVSMTLDHDAAEASESELSRLVWRTSLALLILLGFVWAVSRSWRYLAVISISLLANVLLAALFYWLADIRLHIYSLAGITVSIGIIIDATVVMADHYSYYHNRRAFFAILAALLTTVGSLVVIFWLPEHIQREMYDFALIIMINLTVALLVSSVFVPALIDSLSPHTGRTALRPARGLVCPHTPGRRITGGAWVPRWAVRCKRAYTTYVRFTQRRKWIYVTALVLIFGLPFHAIPESWHTGRTADNGERVGPCERWYNATFGSTLFQRDIKPVLSTALGGTLRLFSEHIETSQPSSSPEREMVLHIQAQMPLGGTAGELNGKVMILEAFLSRQRGIRRFETHVDAWGATVNVYFTQEALREGWPYSLENKVVGCVIGIGGADWSTHGVSERGFSNALNLQYRSNRIELVGYNYERLYRLADDMCREMRSNPRVVDLTIETPGVGRQEDEYFMRYDRGRMALYDFNPHLAHNALREIVSDNWMGRYRDRHIEADIRLLPSTHKTFSIWDLNHTQIDAGGRQVKLSDFMEVERREAKNIIPKRNQEYVLNVAFNMLGSHIYTSRYIRGVIQRFNAVIPIGFRCRNAGWGYYDDTAEQYWMLFVVVVIIFFVCAILFESLRCALAILSLIPVSFIGTFVTYTATGVEFGTGGYAALVLLAGLTVNAGNYVVAEFRSRPQSVDAYIRAFNHKISAVSLTVISTILGLIPFFIDGTANPFWFSFAVGASGGLAASILALLFFMPIVLPLKDTVRRKTSISKKGNK